MDRKSEWIGRWVIIFMDPFLPNESIKIMTKLLGGTVDRQVYTFNLVKLKQGNISRKSDTKTFKRSKACHNTIGNTIS